MTTSRQGVSGSHEAMQTGGGAVRLPAGSRGEGRVARPVVDIERPVVRLAADRYDHTLAPGARRYRPVGSPGSAVWATGSAVWAPGSAVWATGSAVWATGAAVWATGSDIRATGSDHVLRVYKTASYIVKISFRQCSPHLYTMTQ